jgi:hypothetical protein
LGYAQHSKGYRFLVVEPNNSVEVNTVIESKDAEFYENRFTSIPSINDKMVEPIRNNNESGESSESFELRSKRMRKEKSFGPDFIVYLVEGSRDSSCKKEAEWLRNLLMEISIWPKPMSPISLHCDSHATLS